MKTLVLKDGYVLEGTDSSTVYDITTVYTDFAEIDDVRPHLTKENFVGATFNDEEVESIVPEGISASLDGENVVVHFKNRAKTELELIHEEQELQNEVLDALIMGA